MKNVKYLGILALLGCFVAFGAQAYSPSVVDDVSGVFDTDTGNAVGIVPPGQTNVTSFPSYSGSGTFVAIGTTSISVANAAYKASQSVIITLNTVGGTVGALPHLLTATPGTGFTVSGTASDTSTYNYMLLNSPPH